MFTNKLTSLIGQFYNDVMSYNAHPIIWGGLYLQRKTDQSVYCLQGELQRGIPA